MSKKSAYKKRSINHFIFAIVLILLFMIISSNYHFRLDLTSEKKYTLSPFSKEILKKLDQKIYITVYLKGDLPARYKRLQIYTKELLEEFKTISKDIQFDFIDPIDGKSAEGQLEIVKGFSKKGMQPIIIADELKQQIIFPFCILTDGGDEHQLNLEGEQIGIPDEELIINNSIQTLEFKFIRQIRRIAEKNKKKVAILTGHGELNYPDIVDIAVRLDKEYQLSECKIKNDINSLVEDGKTKYDVLIIAKPQSPFSESDKYILDQFIMNGGNILWLIDAVDASLDSLKRKESSLVFPLNLNIEDQLFTYGVRINQNLVMDLYALPIPLNTGPSGRQARIKFFPWNFYPILYPMSNHPIVKNINAIKTEFASSMDTISVKNIHKTILLTSSQKSKLFNTPGIISFQKIIGKQDEATYDQGGKNIAVLLEGKFKSVYKNRLPPQSLSLRNYHKKDISQSVKMIVISDGDLIKNQIHNTTKEPLPLGYDQYTNQNFGNKEFILNSIAYLSGDEEIINLRSREVKLRLLDKVRIKENILFWKLFNVILPIIITLLIGLGYSFYRRRKYRKS